MLITARSASSGLWVAATALLAVCAMLLWLYFSHRMARQVFLRLFFAQRAAPKSLWEGAVKRWRAGDRLGARNAMERYLKLADFDPRRHERIPLALRFLKDETASLEPAETVAPADAPAEDSGR